MKAFIFDLDGVLTDTAKLHYLAWKRLAGDMGLQFCRHDNERLKGVSRLESLEIILEINGKERAFSEEEKRQLAKRKNEEYMRLRQEIKPGDILPGVLPFLMEAKKKGLKLAVASASENAFTVLKGLEIEPCFDYIADASKIVRAKPFPDIFLNCADRLGVRPAQCVGFEDAQAGIEAIHAAGMYAVGIGVHVTTEKPDLILDSTKELNLEKILAKAGGI